MGNKKEKNKNDKQKIQKYSKWQTNKNTINDKIHCRQLLKGHQVILSHGLCWTDYSNSCIFSWWWQTFSQRLLKGWRDSSVGSLTYYKAWEFLEPTGQMEVRAVLWPPHMLALSEVLIWIVFFLNLTYLNRSCIWGKATEHKTHSRKSPQIPRQKGKITKVRLEKTEILPLPFQKPYFIATQNRIKKKKKSPMYLNFCPEVLWNIYDLNVKKHWLSSFTSQQLIMCSLHLISVKQRPKQKPRELFPLVLLHVWSPVGNSIWLAFGL